MLSTAETYRLPSRHLWNQTSMRLSTPPLLHLLFVARRCFQYMQHRNPLIYRTDRSLFELRKLQTKNLVHHTTVRELLFADDCALAAHTIQEAQHLPDCFMAETRRFGLFVSIKKSEVMFQPRVSSCYLPPVATISSIQLPVAETFC